MSAVRPSDTNISKHHVRACVRACVFVLSFLMFGLFCFWNGPSACHSVRPKGTTAMIFSGFCFHLLRVRIFICYIFYRSINFRLQHCTSIEVQMSLKLIKQTQTYTHKTGKQRERKQNQKMKRVYFSDKISQLHRSTGLYTWNTQNQIDFTSMARHPIFDFCDFHQKKITIFNLSLGLAKFQSMLDTFYFAFRKPFINRLTFWHTCWSHSRYCYFDSYFVYAFVYRFYFVANKKFYVNT